MASYPLDFSDRTATSSSSSSLSSSSSFSSLAGKGSGKSKASPPFPPTSKASTPNGKQQKLMSKMTWDGYGEEMLAAFEEFWRVGDFVDVTLICDDLTLRAHRIVLAASSQYFERILCESECKHPVILLNGFQGREVEACLEFIYKGVLYVPSEEVNEIIATAQVLEEHNKTFSTCMSLVIARRSFSAFIQPHRHGTIGSRPLGPNSQPLYTEDFTFALSGHPIRGLADYKLEDMTLEMKDELDLPVDMRNNNRVKLPTISARITSSSASSTSSSVIMTEEPIGESAFHVDDGPRSPKCLNLSMSAHLDERTETAGVTAKTTGVEVPSSLASSTGSSSVVGSNAVQCLRQSPLRRKQARPRRRSGDFVAQDLRKMNSHDENHVIDYTTSTTTNSNSKGKGFHPSDNHNHHQPLLHHLHHQLLHPDLPPIIQQPSPPTNNNSEDGISSTNCAVSPPVSPPYFFPKASPPSPEENHACSTPPTFPGLQFSNGFGQPAPWPGLPLGPAPIFGRHRAQHSAPRGGPPRAWSNADLTEALHNVWNKKMTTSQASRIFGIPYNSLLMYVRGKYGKSLKLDLLKKGLESALENKNNNKSKSPENLTPEFNPFTAGIFSDYPPPFPFATALSHIIPPPGMDVKAELGKTEDLK